MDCDDEGEAAANVLAAAKPNDSRYGNIVMGRRDALPDHPDVASFSFFMSVWRNYKARHYRKTVKLRKWMPFAKCDTCATNRLKMADTECPKVKIGLRSLQREHLERVKRERLSYVTRQQLSPSWARRLGCSPRIRIV